ncbi:CGNR zinc finger domain-containing protein [Sphingomonas lenta]|uniref:CGNR zinc finger domain-containing protein n=1 Tax=Sphingomonas lenta TaxID=1141887 RepID=UPI001C3ECFC8|nr:CGNR zinc finger domain-containing protein [Sphingomonas lenta]
MAGDLALDLANTIGWRGTLREIDYLADADDIAAWARMVGLVEPSYTVPDAARDALVADVHGLRAAIMDAGATIATGSTPRGESMATIRDMAARSLEVASLNGAPATLTFAPDDRIVGPLAWAALDLLRGSELDRLKQCPPNDCRWLFLDRTKNRSRRWCDMATCGNREKARRSR